MNLNNMQQKAVHFDLDQHVLLLAGAGSGKTATIINRVEFLLKKGIAADRILLLTFTKRSASEMVTRLENICGNAALSIKAGTFHSFCLGIMRRMPNLFGLSGSIIIDGDDQRQLMKLSRAENITKDNKEYPKAKELIRYYSYARNTAQTFSTYLKNHTCLIDADINLALEVFKSYEKNKKTHNYIDFDDILVLFANSMQKNDIIRKELKGLFDHILVDEMQDTNPIQWKIIEHLHDPAKLFCVGDDAQSIYAFRGADFKNVQDFTKRIPGGNVLKLSHNYRSYQEILDLSNWLLNKSPLNYGKNLTAARGSGAKPLLINFGSETQEAYWIAKNIAERYLKGAPLKDHMVITRAAYALRTLETALITFNIPYRFIGGLSLLKAAHVKDLICLIRCALSHRDKIAWTRYLTLYPRIGDKTASKIYNHMQPLKSWDDAFHNLSSFFSKQPEISDNVLAVRKSLNKPELSIITAIDALSSLLETKYDKWDNRLKDLELIVKAAQRYRTIPAFLEAFTLEPDHDDKSKQNDNEDILTLITSHSAKGTEAPVCFLIKCEPGVYPHKLSLGDPDAEEEERRILYVAMTRAKDELIITRTLNDSFCDWAEAVACNEEYFLDNLPGSLVEYDY